MSMVGRSIVGIPMKTALPKWDDDAELATSMTLFGKWTKNTDPDQ